MAINSKGTFSANGDSSVLDWIGGKGYLDVWGTFGGGTATLKKSPDGGTTYYAVDTETTLTANGGAQFTSAPCKLLVNLDGATSPNLNYEIVKYDD
jgi:hypothetical protein